MRQLYQLYKAVTSRKIKVEEFLTKPARLKAFLSDLNENKMHVTEMKWHHE